MSDASVTKAVPIEEQSPLVEALHRRLAAAEARIGDWEAVFNFDDYKGDRLLLPAVARGRMAAKDRRIVEFDGLLCLARDALNGLMGLAPHAVLMSEARRFEFAKATMERIDAALARRTT